MAQKCECRQRVGKGGFVRALDCSCGLGRTDGLSVGAGGAIATPRAAVQRRADSRAGGQGQAGLTPQQQRRAGNHKRTRRDAMNDSAWRADAAPTYPDAPLPRRQPSAALTPQQQRRADNYKQPLSATKRTRKDAIAPSAHTQPQGQAGLTSAQRRMNNYRKPLAATKQNRPNRDGWGG